MRPGRERLLDAFRWVDGHADPLHLLRDPSLLQLTGDLLAGLFPDERVDLVLAPEARAFVLAPLVATRLGAGVVVTRKAGAHLPGPTVARVSPPDWRGRSQVHRLRVGDVEPGQRVLVVDDWVETGSAAGTVGALVADAGGELVGVAALVDDTGDEDLRARLRLRSVLRSAELPPWDVGR